MCHAQIAIIQFSKSDDCRAAQENESNLRTKSSNQDKQFSIESLLGKEVCQNICIGLKSFRVVHPVRRIFKWRSFIEVLKA